MNGIHQGDRPAHRAIELMAAGHKRTVRLVIDGEAADATLTVTMFVGLNTVFRFTTKASAMDLRSTLEYEREQGYSYALQGAGIAVQLTTDEAERVATFLELPFPPLENQLESEDYLDWLLTELNRDAAEQGRA